MTDKFQHRAAGSTSPSTHGFAITPDDNAALPQTIRAIYVGTAGNITMTLAEDAELVFANIPAGTILPIRAKSVSATGTTASDLIGLV